MPVITVAVHPIDHAQKSQLIKALTATAVEITKIPADKYVVFIDEYENESIGLGGKTRAQLISESAV